VISRIVAIESASRARMKAMRAVVAQHTDAGSTVIRELERGMLSTETQRHLTP
jgi:hypothetical protein